MGAWVLLYALTRPEGQTLRAQAGLPEASEPAAGPAWDIRWVDGGSLNEVQKVEGRYTSLPQMEAAGLDLADQLAWTYPHRGAADLPSKLTATQIKGRAQDQEAAEHAAPPSRQGQPITRPNFIAEEKGLTPAQRGTALHLAMQYLSLDGELELPAAFGPCRRHGPAQGAGQKGGQALRFNGLALEPGEKARLGQAVQLLRHRLQAAAAVQGQILHAQRGTALHLEIGRASCRERV